MTARLDRIQEQLSELSHMPPAPAVPGVPHMGHHAPRPKTAGERVRAHLAAYPEDHTLSVRQLADKLGVGKSTVSRVKQEDLP